MRAAIKKTGSFNIIATNFVCSLPSSYRASFKICQALLGLEIVGGGGRNHIKFDKLSKLLDQHAKGSPFITKQVFKSKKLIAKTNY